MKLIAGALITAALLAGCSSGSNDETNAAMDEAAKQIQISMIKDSACEQWQLGLNEKPMPTAMRSMALTQFNQLSDLDPELRPIALAAYELRNIAAVMDLDGRTPENTAALSKVWAVVQQYCLSNPE